MSNPMIDRFFAFINDKDESSFIHPIIKAFIIQVYIGYIHPFYDGNGRVARAFWAEIDQAAPDEEPLIDEELRQLKSDAGYVTGEEAKREFGLQTDLP